MKEPVGRDKPSNEQIVRNQTIGGVRIHELRQRLQLGVDVLDGKRRQSPFYGQAKALFTIHAAAADDIETFLRDWNVQRDVPTTFFEALDFLINALKWATEPGDPLKQAYLPALRSIDRKLAEAFDNSGLQAMNAAADALDAETLARDLRESFESRPDIDINAARALLDTTADQIASRGWVLEEPYRQEGLSLIWDRWCDLTANAIKTLRSRQTILREVLRRIDPIYNPSI